MKGIIHMLHLQYAIIFIYIVGDNCRVLIYCQMYQRECLEYLAMIV